MNRKDHLIKNKIKLRILERVQGGWIRELSPTHPRVIEWKRQAQEAGLSLQIVNGERR